MNEQPAEKVWLDPDGRLEVFKIWRTIQGEGPFVGMPAVFIRLAGCNLRCDWCDTDYTSHRLVMDVGEVVSEVCRLSSSGLVVITGGEPLRQNIWKLFKCLRAIGYSIQLETNGTLNHPLLSDGLVHVVCSPKGIGVHPQLVRCVDDWKYVVKAGGLASNGLPSNVFLPTTFRRETIWIQPMDEGDVEKNEQNVRAAVSSCLEHGYRLSLQIHKLAGVE